MKALDYLSALAASGKGRACEEAVDWVGDRDCATAWAECERPDWMIWAARRSGATRQQLVLAACACARLVLHFVPAGEGRPRIAIETAERWTRGDASVEECRAAAYAAADADAADAAYAAYAAATAAAYAAYAEAATNAAVTAAAADADAARHDMRIRCCDAIRSVIPFPVVCSGGAL